MVGGARVSSSQTASVVVAGISQARVVVVVLSNSQAGRITVMVTSHTSSNKTCIRAMIASVHAGAVRVDSRINGVCDITIVWAVVGRSVSGGITIACASSTISAGSSTVVMSSSTSSTSRETSIT